MILASNHRSFLDPFVIGCCLGRPIYFVAKQELFKNPLLGWILNCLGRVPDQARSVRRGVGGDLARAARARPGGCDLSRGHPHPHGLARIAQARRRTPCPSERQARRPDRGHRHRARPPRLADQAGEGPPALRPCAHLPARGRPLALPRRRGHRAHLAVRRAPVGVARRPPAAAHRRSGGRGIDGHSGRGGAGAGRGAGAARLSHRRSGRGAAGRPRELALPPGPPARPDHRP